MEAEVEAEVEVEVEDRRAELVTVSGNGGEFARRGGADNVDSSFP